MNRQYENKKFTQKNLGNPRAYCSAINGPFNVYLQFLEKERTHVEPK